MDDELTLLAVGADTVGDVAVVALGQRSRPTPAVIDLDGDLGFSQALADAGIIDPIAVPGCRIKRRRARDLRRILARRRRLWSEDPLG